MVYVRKTVEKPVNPMVLINSWPSEMSLFRQRLFSASNRTAPPLEDHEAIS